MTEPQAVSGRFITAKEAGVILSVTKDRVYRMITSGMLTPVVIGGRKLLRCEEVKRLNRIGWWGRGRGRSKRNARRRGK